MAIKTIQKLADFKIFYGDTGDYNRSFTDDSGTALDFTGKDVHLTVSTTQTPLIADSPKFTVIGTNSATQGQVAFNLSSTEWDTIVDGDFTNGRIDWFYEIAETDTGASTNEVTLGKGNFIVEIDYKT